MKIFLLCLACFILGNWSGFILTALCVASKKDNDE